MKFFVILIAKLLSILGKAIGKGTSLPGAIALKICPTILTKLQLPDNIIAVTGSNGKTSTVEMIAYIISSSGKKVIYNKEGSNQIEGVTTLLLNNATLSGKVKGDVVILESDERYARHTFKYIKPNYFAITNLYRDQLTRNVHPFRIYDILKDAVNLLPNSTLILNADDPIVRNFGLNRENTVYFGMDKNSYSTEETDALYNDCYYCPVCKEKMDYSFFHYAHLGSYSCNKCGYSRPDTKYTVDSMDLDNKVISINGNKIDLAFASRYNVYNLCTAFASASIVGVSDSDIAKYLSDFIMKNGRVVEFYAGENKGMLITSKHENSTSYNQSLEYVCREKDNSNLYIIVDAISRKYYTSETSWLWDITFEKLKNSNVKKVMLCGKYAYDLGVRFSTFTLSDMEVVIETNLDKMAEDMKTKTDRKLFVITCFSDKDKLYSRVEVKSPTAK